MANFTDSPILTNRFSEALVFAHQAHLHQVRKGGTKAPYISHLLAVASLVLEAGGNEDEAIAALLHDAIEDVQVEPRLIIEKFGENVCKIVQELSEDKALPKKERKSRYIESVCCFSNSAIRVSIADKLHNIRCYSQSPELWGKEQYEFYKDLLFNYEQFVVSNELLENQVIEIGLLMEQLS
ncbi:HD domain-containing protein [Nostoc punctiforme]|nr:HD domain-containing protein [Nostoc punctiforme]RCJ41057.1 hypothetical protein A6769_38995 [Nostoc punctiforme NIES-2108]